MHATVYLELIPIFKRNSNSYYKRNSDMKMRKYAGQTE
jgi:hypothetical protein